MSYQQENNLNTESREVPDEGFQHTFIHTDNVKFSEQVGPTYGDGLEFLPKVVMIPQDHKGGGPSSQNYYSDDSDDDGINPEENYEDDIERYENHKYGQCSSSDSMVG